MWATVSAVGPNVPCLASLAASAGLILGVNNARGVIAVKMLPGTPVAIIVVVLRVAANAQSDAEADNNTATLRFVIKMHPLAENSHDNC